MLCSAAFFGLIDGEGSFFMKPCSLYANFLFYVKGVLVPDEQGHPALQEIALGAVLAALADGTRRHVIRELLRDVDGAERHCTSFGLALSKATRSHHFRVLREAGLIRQVDRGNSRMAQLRRADIERRFPGLLALVAAESAAPEGDGAPTTSGDQADTP